MIGRANRLLVAAVLATVAGGPTGASAHLGHVVQRAERYIKVDVTPAKARIVVTLVLGRSEAVRVLESADADGDGAVSRQEADAYLAQWGDGLAEELLIEVDGEPAEPRWDDGYLDPVGPIQPMPATVEMVAELPLDGGRHRIVVVDEMRVHKYDRTDVTFRVRQGVRLIASGLGDPEEPSRQLAYGARAPRGQRLAARVDVPGSSRSQRAVAYGAAAGLLGLAAAAWVALWKRARRRRATAGTGTSR